MCNKTNLAFNFKPLKRLVWGFHLQYFYKSNDHTLFENRLLRIQQGHSNKPWDFAIFRAHLYQMDDSLKYCPWIWLLKLGYDLNLQNNETSIDGTSMKHVAFGQLDPWPSSAVSCGTYLLKKIQTLHHVSRHIEKFILQQEELWRAECSRVSNMWKWVNGQKKIWTWLFIPWTVYTGASGVGPTTIENH